MSFFGGPFARQRCVDFLAEQSVSVDAGKGFHGFRCVLIGTFTIPVKGFFRLFQGHPAEPVEFAKLNWAVALPISAAFLYSMKARSLSCFPP